MKGMTSAIGQTYLVCLLSLSWAFAAAPFAWAENHERIVEINVMLAWLADPALCRYYPSARVAGNSVHVSGYLPNRKLRGRALKIASAATRFKIVDGLTVHPRIALRAMARPAAELLYNGNQVLREEFSGDCRGTRLSLRGVGQLSLEGQVYSHESRLRISERLRRLPGCVCIINKLRLADQSGLASHRPALREDKSTSLIQHVQPPPQPPAAPKRLPHTVHMPVFHQVSANSRATTIERGKPRSSLPLLPAAPKPSDLPALETPPRAEWATRRQPAPQVDRIKWRPANSARAKRNLRSVTSGHSQAVGRLLSKLYQLCGSSAKQISLRFQSDNELKIWLTAKNQAEAKRLAKLIFRSPSFSKFDIQLSVKTLDYLQPLK